MIQNNLITFKAINYGMVNFYYYSNTSDFSINKSSRLFQQAMTSSRKSQLEGKVQVDEFLIGEYEEGKVGRSADSKKKLVT